MARRDEARPTQALIFLSCTRLEVPINETTADFRLHPPPNRSESRAATAGLHSVCMMRTWVVWPSASGSSGTDGSELRCAAATSSSRTRTGPVRSRFSIRARTSRPARCATSIDRPDGRGGSDAIPRSRAPGPTRWIMWCHSAGSAGLLLDRRHARGCVAERGRSDRAARRRNADGWRAGAAAKRHHRSGWWNRCRRHRR